MRTHLGSKACASSSSKGDHIVHGPLFPPAIWSFCCFPVCNKGCIFMSQSATDGRLDVWFFPFYLPCSEPTDSRNARLDYWYASSRHQHPFLLPESPGFNSIFSTRIPDYLGIPGKAFKTLNPRHRLASLQSRRPRTTKLCASSPLETYP